MKTTVTTALTFAASVAFGCAAAIAIASSAAVSQTAPSLRPVATAPTEVVRLDPVVVTISRAAFDAIRNDGNEVAATAARRASRG